MEALVDQAKRGDEEAFDALARMVGDRCRDGVGFVLVLRDPAVQGSTDSTDRAILEALIDSVVFAGT